jgi:hypothetical protein
MRKITIAVLILMLLIVTKAYANEATYSRMETGDLSRPKLLNAFAGGDYKKAEQIAKTRVAEELYTLALIQEIQLNCKEARETLQYVLKLVPDHKGATEDLKNDSCR